MERTREGKQRLAPLLHGLRRKSLFYKTLGMLLLLSVITVIFFGVYINRLVVQSQRERIDALNLAQLQSIGDNMDTRLQTMAAAIEQSLWSSDFVSLMVNPYQADSDAAYRVVDVLAGYVSGDQLVQEAFLYLSASGEVYSSDQASTDAEAFSGQEALAAYLALREEGRPSGEDTFWKVFDSGGQLYLAVDFCVPNFIGAILAQLDMERMYGQIQTENASWQIQVFDGEGHSLLGGGVDLSPQEREQLQDGKSGDWYCYTAPESGWLYRTNARQPGSSPSALSALGMALPFLLIYVLVSQLFSVYITRSVYQPINRLMQITAGHQGRIAGEGGPRSETDYLELAYEALQGENLDLQGKNEQYRQLMESVSRDVVEQLFRNILARREISREQVEKTLEGIGMSGLLTGRYLVLAGVLILPADRELTLVETNLYQRSVLGIVNGLGQREGNMFPFFMERGILAIIGSFPQDMSVLRVKSWARDLMAEVERQTQSLPYEILLGKGKVYNEILALADSYQEAVAEIRYRRYVAESAEADSLLDFGPRYYRERGRQIGEMAEKSSREEAEKAAEGLVREISEGEEPGACLPYYELLLEGMLEKLADCHVLDDEKKSEAFLQAPEELRRLTAVPEMSAYMDEFYRKAIREIQSMGKKSRYKYVKAAKEYIQEQYWDGNLSLNQVSEAIGISAPYLSGIFAESVKGGFSSYLNSIRVERAKTMLAASTESAAEIGFQCGFNSAQSFSRVFKKYTGFTPGQYREHQKREGKP